MDEVVGGVHALAGAAQAAGVEHVALVELVAGVARGGRRDAVTHQRAHVRAALGERRGEPASDEAGGSGYECCAWGCWYHGGLGRKHWAPANGGIEGVGPEGGLST